jgi:hypothetical protein
LFVTIFLGSAKCQTTIKKSNHVNRPVFGELDGFVFAITKSGDLKPARLAHVAALYNHQNGLDPKEEFPHSAGTDHLRFVLGPSMKTLGKAEARQPSCDADLQDYVGTIKLTKNGLEIITPSTE